MGMKEDLTTVRNSRADVSWREGGEVPNCVVSFKFSGTFVFELMVGGKSHKRVHIMRSLKIVV